MCSICPASLGILLIPITMLSTCENSTSGRTTPALLGALEQRLAGCEQPRATLFEQSRVRIEIVQQFGRQRPLRGEIADQPLEPLVERLPRVGTVELRCGVADLLEFVDVESLQQRLPVREVPVERPDPDARTARDLLERR